MKQERGLAHVRYCGTRQKRLNPCWSEGGLGGATTPFCLPHFFILGEMKCGTTTLYELLLKHPRMVPPRTKEPRFLQQGRFSDTTVSRYALYFQSAVLTGANDTVTFDASPVYLRSKVARFWISRWLPESRLVVLVRNPVQRTYSHWKMGRDWIDSKCTGAPRARIQMVDQLLSFRAIAQRSLVQMYWEKCALITGSKPVHAPGNLEFMQLPDSIRAADKDEGGVLYSSAAERLQGNPWGKCMVAQVRGARPRGAVAALRTLHLQLPPSDDPPHRYPTSCSAFPVSRPSFAPRGSP